jgi:hypothetical protein
MHSNHNPYSAPTSISSDPPRHWVWHSFIGSILFGSPFAFLLVAISLISTSPNSIEAAKCNYMQHWTTIALLTSLLYGKLVSTSYVKFRDKHLYLSAIMVGSIWNIINYAALLLADLTYGHHHNISTEEIVRQFYLQFGNLSIGFVVTSVVFCVPLSLWFLSILRKRSIKSLHA